MKQFTTRDLGRLTLDDLRTYLGQRYSRQLAHNTWVEGDREGSIGIRFHSTRILTFHPDGTFSVNTGGWQTVTTKQRLNALLPAGFRVFSERYCWKISTPEGVFPFVDGDTWKVGQ